jgi:hypothetical protein
MARIAWTDFGNRPAEAFLIVAEIAPDFGGGPRPDDPFDTARLRFAANLMVRTCTQSKLAGDFAVQPLRDNGALLIHCAVTEPDDFARLRARRGAPRCAARHRRTAGLARCRPSRPRRQGARRRRSLPLGPDLTARRIESLLSRG